MPDRRIQSDYCTEKIVNKLRIESFKKVLKDLILAKKGKYATQKI